MLLGALSDSTVAITAAIIGAAGSIISAYIAVVVRSTRTSVNGRLDELQVRVQLLTELLEYARAQDAEPRPPAGTPLRMTRHAGGTREP